MAGAIGVSSGWADEEAPLAKPSTGAPFCRCLGAFDGKITIDLIGSAFLLPFFSLDLFLAEAIQFIGGIEGAFGNVSAGGGAGAAATGALPMLSIDFNCDEMSLTVGCTTVCCGTTGGAGKLPGFGSDTGLGAAMFGTYDCSAFLATNSCADGLGADGWA